MPSSFAFLNMLLRGLLTAEFGVEPMLQPGEGTADCKADGETVRGGGLCLGLDDCKEIRK